MLATEMGAGQPAIASDRVGQCPARIDGQSIMPAVDVQSDIVRLCHLLLPHARACTASRIRRLIRRGVAGNSLITTPNGTSASLIALTTAAGAPIAPPSPNPFALVIVAS